MPVAIAAIACIALPGRVQATIGPGKTTVTLYASKEPERCHLAATHRQCSAFYVLQRSSMDYDWESLKQDFLPKILQATGKHPF